MSAARLLVAVFATMLNGSNVIDQPHSDSPVQSSDNRPRRDSAVNYLAAVNRAQAHFQRERGTYGSLSDLPSLPTAPMGLIPRLLHEQWSYMIILKDFFDGCGLAYFSDERGIIYEARPLGSRSTTSPLVGPKGAALADADESPNALTCD